MALWQRSLQTIGSTLAFGLISAGTAWGQTIPFVVLRSSMSGQQYQWSSLNQRLNQANIHYCTVEQGAAIWPTPQPGQGLLLPSVNAVSPAQVTQLQQWLQAGGQVIVTGPTGSLSSDAVRSQLQDLLGSHWAFPLPTSTSLTVTAEFPNAAALTAPDRGATVLPTQPQTQVLAQWQTQRPTPAVVATAKTAALGWQWGLDTATDADTDVAWLQAIINHQDIPTTAPHAGTGLTCAESAALALENPAIAPSPPHSTVAMGGTAPEPPPEIKATQPTPPDPAVRNHQTVSDRPDPATLLAAAPHNLRQRYALLQQFVGRYESAIIAAESQNSPDVTFLDTVQRRANQRTTPNALPQNLQTVRQGMARINQFLAAQDYRGAGAEIQELERRLWAQYPMEQPINHAESRAMWLDRGTIVRARSERELARVFNRLANAGINTVFFETLNASYPIYPSDVAPEQNPLTEGWDPLAAAVKLAHERGMELHAWVWIFAAANQRHNQVLGQPATYLGPVLSRNPDWAMSDRRGNPFQPNSRKAFFDPANPEVRAYLTSILDEIATNYDVDGIQLDYIRYPFQDPRKDLTFGYGIAARRQFYQATGVDPATIRPRDRLWQQWTRFRIEQVTGFVEEATTMLRRDHPDVLISAAVFPFPARDRLPKLQQNWETWIERDYLDFLVPMTYAEDTAEFQTLTSPVINHMSRGSTLLMPGIRLLKLPTVVAFDQLQHLRDQATGGYALFAAENLSLNLQSLLQSQQGRRTSTATQPIAHRQPLVTAHARYQALQQEWQYWAAHEAVDLDPRALEQWATQAALVEARLAAAAESPSRANLRQAQAQLTQFERQFERWLSPMATHSGYRVQVWQNRLAGVGQLLRYGQRRGLQ